MPLLTYFEVKRQGLAACFDQKVSVVEIQQASIRSGLVVG